VKGVTVASYRHLLVKWEKSLYDMRQAHQEQERIRAEAILGAYGAGDPRAAQFDRAA
jgi:hypothetical protein